MRGIAVIGGGSFNNPSLPKINIKSVPVIPGARYDWAADNTALGPTQNWFDQIQAGRVTARSDDSTRWPTSSQATNRYLSFDGVDDMLEGDLDMTGNRTLVVVGRFPTPANGLFMVSGGVGAGPHNLHSDTAGNYAFSAGGAPLTSTKKVDGFWHCFIVVTKGTGSVLHIDGQEWTANLPDSKATSLRLGGASSGFYKTDISRVTVLPYAADVNERASIRAVMKAHYNLF